PRRSEESHNQPTPRRSAESHNQPSQLGSDEIRRQETQKPSTDRPNADITEATAFDRQIDALLLYLHSEDIFHAHRTPTGNQTETTLVLSFAALNRMRMRKLQAQLVEKIMLMHFRNEIPEGWEDLLSKYIASVRDNDFVQTTAHRVDDPFTVDCRRLADADVLKKGLACISDRGEEWKDVAFPKSRDKKNSPWSIGGGNRKQKYTTARIDRFLFGIIGGTLLVGPMWLMVLHKTKMTGLISTTVFVFAFILLMVYQLDTPFTVLAATAAYAAVLVVFVGTNN
ncbi:hypothetical protein CC80DRAFT_495708, partial [Byssothecium circinans]